MKIEITRSFSKKIQVARFEPVEFFCSASLEITKDEVEKSSAWLDNFVQKEVEKSAAKFGRGVDHKKSGDVGLDSAQLDAENNPL